MEPWTQEAIADSEDLALTLGIAMAPSPAHARATPTCLVPATISEAAYDHGVQAARWMADVQWRIAQDLPWLTEALKDTAAADPFVRRVLEVASEPGDHAKLLAITRTDFFETDNSSVRLVESNTISAGMCAQGGRTADLHRILRAKYAQLHKAAPGQLVDGHFDVHQAAFMASVVPSGHLCVFVVQNPEDNRYDQRLLEIALAAEGVVVVRRTLGQLAHELVVEDGVPRLTGPVPGTVGLFYFRAGYCPEDFPTEHEWRALSLIEHSYAAHACPTAALHLAGTKTVQMRLSTPGGTDLARFDDGRAAQHACTLPPMYGAATASALAALKEGEWVLKSQGEGGGHCVFDDIPKAVQELGAAAKGYCIMEKIRAKEQVCPLNMFLGRDGARHVPKMVTEVGFFVGRSETRPAEYLGYLCRSKAPETKEGGVHAGFAVVNALVVQN